MSETGLTLTITSEGAQVLRDFASAIPLAVDNIVEQTSTLLNVYTSLSEKLGVHNEDFHNMLLKVSEIQKKAADAISELPPKMLNTAAKIDAYVAAHPEIS